MSWLNIFKKSGPYSTISEKISATSGYTNWLYSEKNALKINAVWACVQLISQTIGSLPVHVYHKNDKGDQEKVPGHRVKNLLGAEPNSMMTAVEYREAVLVNLLLTGNSYSLKSFNGGGEVVSVIPMPFDRIHVYMRGETKKYAYTTITGQRVDIPASKIMHIKGFGYDGLEGLSPISYCCDSLGYAKSLEKTGKAVADNGMRQGGIISIDAYLKADQREFLRDQYEDSHSGIDNAHKLMVLEGNMQFTPNAIPAKDAEFLGNREFQVAEIARIYNVPPHMIGETSKTTTWGSGIEQMNIGFTTYTLRPYLTRLEQVYNRELFTAKDRAQGYTVKLSIEGLLRGDSAGRSEFLSKMVNNGIMTRNEARQKENLPKSDQDVANQLTIQSQMVLGVVNE